MTDAIPPIAASSFMGERAYDPPTVPATAADSTSLEVSRAAEAPVYVYRVLDTQTGRTLVEIPRESEKSKADRSGALVDTRI